MKVDGVGEDGMDWPSAPAGVMPAAMLMPALAMQLWPVLSARIDSARERARPGLPTAVTLIA